MTSKEKILSRCRESIRERYDMPVLDDIEAIRYPDPLRQFLSMTEKVGGRAVELAPGQNINDLIVSLFHDAKRIASNLPEIHIASLNPDTVAEAQDLDGTELGIIRGCFGVAENACVWVPQTMKERAVCFISEHLLILLPKSEIVHNMHEAYQRLTFNDHGYGTFISGPSKTADIAQVLVMGAQAARSVTVVLVP